MGSSANDGKSILQLSPADNDQLRFFRPVVLAAITALALYLCWKLAAPFADAFTWGFALAVASARCADGCSQECLGLLILVDLGLVLVNRSFGNQLIRTTKGNHALWRVSGVTATLLSTALFWPAGRHLFHFGRLHADDLTLIAAVVVFVAISLEFFKRFWRTRFAS